MRIAVDTSAIVAILWGEAEEGRLRARMDQATGALVSMANLVELQLVLAGRRMLPQWHVAESLLADYRIAARAFDEQQLALARDAAIRFGKGRHKAGLNFGDCFAYALAKSEDIPLLCTGSDFALTDVAIA
jgi:ribonuclease VapC